MILKALLATSLAGSALGNFDYKLFCEHVKKSYSYEYSSTESWSSSSGARENYDQVSRALSAGGRVGIYRAQVSASMNNVHKARTEWANSQGHKQSHGHGFQPNKMQIHRRCVHTLNIKGEALEYEEVVYKDTEVDGWGKGNAYWEQAARDYINNNIVPGFSGAKPITRGTTLRLTYGVDLDGNNGWDIQEWVTVTDGYWGNWGPEHRCPRNSYANIIKVRVEGSQGGGQNDDDTGLNGIKVGCQKINGMKLGDHGVPVYSFRSTGAVLEDNGHWGTWTSWETCKHHSFIASIRIHMEPATGNNDDTAANGLSMDCRTAGGMYDGDWSGIKELANMGWGSWTSWRNCPVRMYMCGFQTRIEPDQGSGSVFHGHDDTALNGMRVLCCRLPYDTTY